MLRFERSEKLMLTHNWNGSGSMPHGLDQAITEAERINAAHELHLFGQQRNFDLMAWNGLSAEARGLASEYDIEEPETELERLAIADFADQFATDSHYGVDFVERRSRPSGSNSVHKTTTTFEVLLAGNGPTVILHGELTAKGKIDPDSLEIVGSCTAGAFPIRCEGSHAEALAWFAELVVA